MQTYRGPDWLALLGGLLLRLNVANVQFTADLKIYTWGVMPAMNASGMADHPLLGLLPVALVLPGPDKLASPVAMDLAVPTLGRLI